MPVSAYEDEIDNVLTDQIIEERNDVNFFEESVNRYNIVISDKFVSRNSYSVQTDLSEYLDKYDKQLLSWQNYSDYDLKNTTDLLTLKYLPSKILMDRWK